MRKYAYGASGLTQAEKLGGVGRGDGDVIDGAVGGDRVGDESPEGGGAEVGADL
jgi:hypothetical protein